MKRILNLQRRSNGDIMSKYEQYLSTLTNNESNKASSSYYNQYMLTEDSSYFMSNAIELLDESIMDWISSLGSGGKALWDGFVCTIAGAPLNPISTTPPPMDGIQQGSSGNILASTGLAGKVQELGTWLGNAMRKHANITAAGLAGAGLLGTYYLFKKFREKKKLDNRDRDMAAKIDKMDAKKVSNMAV